MAKRTKTYKDFQKWLKSDNVIKVAANGFREQCSQYAILFTRKSLYSYFKKEYT